jgi:hypothetical protein
MRPVLGRLTVRYAALVNVHAGVFARDRVWFLWLGRLVLFHYLGYYNELFGAFTAVIDALMLDSLAHLEIEGRYPNAAFIAVPYQYWHRAQLQASLVRVLEVDFKGL